MFGITALCSESMDFGSEWVYYVQNRGTSVVQLFLQLFYVRNRCLFMFGMDILCSDLRCNCFYKCFCNYIWNHCFMFRINGFMFGIDVVCSESRCVCVYNCVCNCFVLRIDVCCMFGMNVLCSELRCNCFYKCFCNCVMFGIAKQL